MKRDVIRRIIAWIGIVFAVAFAVFFVLKFWYPTDNLITALTWTSLAVAVIAIGLVRIVIPKKEESQPFLDDTDAADDCESDIDDAENDVPDSIRDENGEKEDNGS